jgi:hypothetical protein
MSEEIYDKISNLCTQNTMTWAPIKYQQDSFSGE